MTTQDITFNRVILHGDSQYPLLFLLTLSLLTHMLKLAGVIYRIHNRIVSHLVYVYDMKVFARKPEDMEKYKEIIERFRKYICMYFGIDKCAVFHKKNGVIFDSPCVTGTPLLSGEDNYKYLGILECDVILLKEVKEDVQNYYISRLHDIIKAWM